MPAILIVGESGSGKSTAIRTLPENDTFIISVSKGDIKPLPFKGWKKRWIPNKNIIQADSADRVIVLLTTLLNKAPDKYKYVVVDDAQYIMGFDFLKKATEQGFNKFSIMAQKFIEVVELLNKLNATSFILMHSDDEYIDGVKKSRAKTLGKLINQNITFEGLFTVVLFTEILKTDKGHEYTFLTNNRGDSTAKSPLGMFEESNIPNDLMLVANKVKEFDEE